MERGKLSTDGKYAMDPDPCFNSILLLVQPPVAQPVQDVTKPTCSGFIHESVVIICITTTYF